MSNESVANVTLAADTTSAVSALQAALPTVLITLCISTFLANVVVLAAFVKNRQLRTPFNIYLINLLIANICEVILDLPFTVVEEFFQQWPLGTIACNFNLYVKWTIPSVIRNTHALISVNRLWAMFFPLHYRNFHGNKVAMALSAGVWLWSNIFLLPLHVPDFMYLRQKDGACLINTSANRGYATFVQFLIFNLSFAFIVGTYPIIWWKIRQRRGVLPTRAEKVKQANEAEQPDGKGAAKGAAATERQNQRNQNESDSFAALTYLVIGVILCWTPATICYTMNVLHDYFDLLFFVVASFLQYSTSLLDPIFFTMAIRPLRMTIRKMVGLGSVKNEAKVHHSDEGERKTTTYQRTVVSVDH